MQTRISTPQQVTRFDLRAGALPPWGQPFDLSYLELNLRQELGTVVAPKIDDVIVTEQGYDATWDPSVGGAVFAGQGGVPCVMAVSELGKVQLEESQRGVMAWAWAYDQDKATVHKAMRRLMCDHLTGRVMALQAAIELIDEQKCQW
ncbi:MAG: hypothetical protein E6Q40_15640 [Cupriavidus sp.]|nr:MAG: hypothetical protein E6Q40_15640 [Cupriavidus sp.]